MQQRRLPRFLNAQHIQDILKISSAEANRLLDLNICPLIIIGNTKRVLAEDFFVWLEVNQSNKWVT